MQRAARAFILRYAILRRVGRIAVQAAACGHRNFYNAAPILLQEKFYISIFAPQLLIFSDGIAIMYITSLRCSWYGKFVIHNIISGAVRSRE